MNQKLTSPLFWTAIIGAVKIVLDTVGIQVIDNQKIDSLANGLSTAAVLIGVFVDHGALTTKALTMQDILDAITKLVADVQPITVSGDVKSDSSPSIPKPEVSTVANITTVDPISQTS